MTEAPQFQPEDAIKIAILACESKIVNLRRQSLRGRYREPLPDRLEGEDPRNLTEMYQDMGAELEYMLEYYKKLAEKFEVKPITRLSIIRAQRENGQI